MIKSRKRIALILAVAGAMAIWPATFIFLRSVWVTEVTASEDNRENSLIFLSEEAYIGRNNAHERKHLSESFVRLNVHVPIISTMPSKLSFQARTSSEYVPIIQFSSCFEPKLIDDPKKLKAVRIEGWPYRQRVVNITRASNLLLAQKLGTVRLAAISACLQATPFTTTCSDWLDQAVVGDAPIIAALVKKGDILLENGFLCWKDNDYEAAPLGPK